MSRERMSASEPLGQEQAQEQELTLDYPNREVLDSISRLYLDNVYRVEGFTALGSNLWRALRDGDIEGAVKLYNTALAGIPYQDFTRQNESLYRSLFLMLLRGAGVTAQGEVPTNRGRSDVLVLFSSRAVVLEFKLAQSAGEVERLRAEGVAVADWAKGIGLRPDDVADFMFGQALRAAPDADAASPQDVSGGGAFPPARPSLRVVT